jgi:endonuclease/exonuclease/phosphatase (EEP) superfamily protein YafD
MADLTQVLAEMTSSYVSLDVLARSQNVNASDVAKAIAKADPDSVEMVALQALAKWNPVQVTVQEEAPKDAD